MIVHSSPESTTHDLPRQDGCRLRYIRYSQTRYHQVHLYDENNHILWWFDSKDEYQEFRWTIIGYKKNGEPEWKCDIINSTVHFILDETNRYKDWKSQEVADLHKANQERFYTIFAKLN